MKLLILDTETGGLDPEKHSILQVGAILWELDAPIVGQPVFEQKIIEMPCNVDPEALAVNGIDIARHRQVALTPGEALHGFKRWLDQHFDEEKVVLGGHNIGFDVSFIRRLYRVCYGEDGAKLYEERFSHRTLDTASIARFLIMAGLVPVQDPKSNSLFEHFGVSPERPHDALEDAIATARLLNKLLEVVRGRA